MGRRPDLPVPTAEDVERETKVLQLRIAGASFDQIAKTIGYADRAGAHKAYQRAMSRVYAEPAAELREIAAARLDAMLTAVWRQAAAGDLKAVDCVLRIETRRAKLLGLDAPQQIDAGVTVRYEVDGVPAAELP